MTEKVKQRPAFSAPLIKRCPKCVSDDVEYEYIGGSDEHLEVTCITCGFVYEMQCASKRP